MQYDQEHNAKRRQLTAELCDLGLSFDSMQNAPFSSSLCPSRSRIRRQAPKRGENPSLAPYSMSTCPVPA